MDTEEYVAGRIARAKLGDALAAAEAAIGIHRIPALAERLNVSGLYKDFLARALRSGDAEFLVCVGDELAAGIYLKRDLRAAQDFYLRADKHSGYMGAYALGKMHRFVKTPFARRFFRKAARNGHVVSLVLYHELLSRSVPLLRIPIRSILALIDCWEIHRAFHSENRRERFWRIQDVLRGRSEKLNQKMPEDRSTPLEHIKKLVDAVVPSVSAQGRISSAGA